MSERTTRGGRTTGPAPPTAATRAASAAAGAGEEAAAIAASSKQPLCQLKEALPDDLRMRRKASQTPLYSYRVLLS